MIKHLLINILFFAVFISSCHEKRQKENESIVEISKLTHNRNDIILYKKSNVSDTLFANGAPEITMLPFGSEKWLKPNNKTRSEQKNYRLPFIKSIRYMNLDSLLRYVCTNGEPIDTSVLKIVKYNYRLPNIGKYQVFYTWVFKGSFGKDPLLLFIKNNCNMLYDDFGYLILYNSLTMNAVVINVANDYYIDAVEERDFFIDKNYIIHLIDRSWTDGDEDSQGNQTDGYLGSQKRTIKILKNGEIKVINNE